MEEIQDEDERIIPKWSIGEKLIYKIWKQETFNFVDEQSPPFERTYTLELTLLEDDVVEAFYPNSLLSAIKLVHPANPYFSKINHSQHNTLYYKIDDYFKFVELKNLDQLLQNISKIKAQLIPIIQPEEYEDIIENLEFIEESPSYAEKHFIKDIEVLHDFYGSVIYDGYYFDLIQKESTAKALKSKLLSMTKLKLGKIDILHTDFLDDHQYQIELLRGHDTFSTLTRQDFKAIQKQFLNHQFNIKNYGDITLHHQRYIYDTADFLVRSYDYSFVIDTPQMKKRMKSRIERID